MATQNPDQAVLERAFSNYKKDNHPDSTEGEAFEYFCGEELTKEFALTSGDVKKGIVGGDHDGGVDGFYVFVNGNQLLDIDSPIVVGDVKAVKSLQQDVLFDVVVFQSKWTDSWQSDPLSKLRDTLERVLVRDASVKDLEAVYSSSLIERTGIFRSVYENTLDKFAKFRFKIFYVTKGPEENLEDNEDAKAKAESLRASVTSMLPSASSAVEVELLGAKGMCEILRSSPSTVSTITFTGPFIKDEKSFVGLARLGDYLRFIRQEGGAELRPGIFDSNVRDFSGNKTNVNSAIHGTVVTDDGPTFGWLNNGVTVLCDAADDAPPLSVRVRNPLVVNGLQTSNVLHEAQLAGQISDERLGQGVLVRIIVSGEEDTRDRAIASTNRQTSIQPVQLHATEELQREIEEFLETQGWYYERRKHQYRGAGRPANRIVSMAEMAQIMIAVSLARPDDARARPQSLTNDDSLYAEIFPVDLDRNAYVAAARVMAQADEYLKTDEAKAIFDDSTNARFYLAAGVVMRHLKAYTPQAVHWDKNFHKIPQKTKAAAFSATLKALAEAYAELSAENPDFTKDQIFKGKALKTKFFARLGA